jgi:hypothetical protein
MNEEFCSFIGLVILLVVHILLFIKIGIKMVVDTPTGNYFDKWYYFTEKWSKFAKKWSKLEVF